jgi:hypothetical protein
MIICNSSHEYGLKVNGEHRRLYDVKIYLRIRDMQEL